MTVRKALVIVAGQVQELPASDSLAGASSGGSVLEVDINGDLMPVTDTGAADLYFEADGNGDVQPKA